jgi:LPS-assembly protein
MSAPRSADKAYASADSARMEGKEVLRLEGVEYTACAEGRPGCPDVPAWRIRAGGITENLEDHSMWYRNAVLYMWDVPVFYLPVLYSYDPTVKDKTGLLTPSIEADSTLGTVYKQPLFVKINDYNDMTITPKMTSNRGVIWDGEYRTNQKYMAASARGSYKGGDEYYAADPSAARWYFRSVGDAEFSDVWRASFDIERTSDKTYMRIYELNSSPWTTSTAALEGIRNRSYLTARFYEYQNMRTLPNDYTPLVLPVVDYSRSFDPNSLGGVAEFKFNSARIIREYRDPNILDEGYVRASSIARYAQPVQTDWGGVATFAAAVRGDFYSLSDIGGPGAANAYSGSQSRGSASASIKLEAPMYRKSRAGVGEILEPIVQVVSSPKHSASPNIPNMDSKFMEVDAFNLFEEDRFAGYDVFESGARANYGLRYSRSGSEKLSVFVGQNYNIDVPEDLYTDGSGLKNGSGFSDVVASVQYVPAPFLSVNYKTRLEQETLAVNRHDLSLGVGPPAFRFSSSYVYFKSMYVEDEEPIRKDEAQFSLSSRLTAYLDANTWVRYDLEKSKVLSRGGSVVYSNNCLRFALNLYEEFTSDADYLGKRSISFTLALKTLGEISSSFNITPEVQ